jgi:hypothetical protein
MSTWRSHTAKGKHGITFSVYQYVAKDWAGLNVALPSIFAPRRREAAKLNAFVAYYLAHACKNREFLIGRKSDAMRDYTGTILLSLLAEDSATAAGTPPHEEPTAVTWRAGIATFEEQYDHYHEMEFWPGARLAGYIEQTHLAPFSELFEAAQFGSYFWLVSERGIASLVEEWPDIAEEFDIEPNSPWWKCVSQPIATGQVLAERGR